MKRLFFCILFFNTIAAAQQAPNLGYVFPPVVGAGVKTNVQLGGYDFTPDMQFFVHRKDIKLTPLGEPGEFIIPPPPYWFGERSRETAFLIPREIPATIETPADSEPGLVHWQVANANGSSSTAVFYVSNETEILEQRDRQFTQLIEELPIAISGRLERIAEVDRYRITPLKTGPVTVELFARRLGSNFNGLIEVRDANDRLLTSVADTQGNDIVLTFAAQAKETYEIRLHDIDFRGNQAFVYRLAIRQAPRIVTAVPAAGQRGKTQLVTLAGFGVATGSAKWESVDRKIAFPNLADATHFTYEFNNEFGATTFDIPLSNIPEGVAGPSGSKIVVDHGYTGEMNQSGEAVFQFEAKKGKQYKIIAQSQAVGGGLDLSLTIKNEADKQLLFADDTGNSLDPEVVFTAPADGVFTCVLTDPKGGRGYFESIYRLAIEPLAADFTLSAPQQLKLPIGGKGSLQVNVIRLGGHNEEITLEIGGLPPGVSAKGELVVPAGKSVLKIPLEATAEAASTAVLLNIVGKSKSATGEIARTCACAATGSLCPTPRNDSTVADVMLAVTLPPKFELKLFDRNRQRAVNRGTTYPAPFSIERNDGFTGEVILQMAAKQGRHRQGITAPTITVPGDVSEALFPCFMPEWLETDRTTRMVVLGVAKQRDPAGKIRYVTKPADARITMILEGALLKVSHLAKDVTLPIGDMVEIPVQVARSNKLKTNVVVKLIPPAPLREFMQCDPITLSAEQTGGVLRVRTKNELKLPGRWAFQIKATGMQDDRWPVISQTELQVEIAPQNGP